MPIFGGSKSSKSTSVTNEQTSFDASANASGASTTVASDGSKIAGQLIEGSGLSLNKSSIGNDNLVIGAGGTFSVVNTTDAGAIGAAFEASQEANFNALAFADAATARNLETVDALASNAFDFGGDALAASLGLADSANARALNFGSDALAANQYATESALGFGGDALAASLGLADSANARALGFGESSLSTLGDFAAKAFETIKSFGESAFQGANQRAGDAVAAVERLAAVPAYRNAEAPEPVNKNLLIVVFAAVGLVLAVVLGSRPKK